MKYLRKSTGFRYAIPFLAVLGVLTVVSFIIPLRPTQSQMEKRNLAEFPEFTWESLVSGDYFDDISLWFSDTFPGREEWLQVSSSLESLHGYSEISIAGDLNLSQPADSVPAVSEPIPSQNPQPEEPIIAPTEDPEEETLAAEETQDQWGGLDAGNDDDVELGDGTLIQIGDTVFNQAGFSDICSTTYAQTLSQFADVMAEKNIRVISAPAPTAVGILVEPAYLEKLNCADQNATIAYMHSLMGTNVITVDTYAPLVAHNDEYIYFRTDHHWSALGAYYAYSATCEAMGYTPAALSDFEVWNQGEFEGSLYWRAPYPKKLKLDTVDAYIPQGDIQVTVYDSQGGSRESQLLFDTTNRAANTKYLTFLGTDYAMTEITNNSIPDGPSCIIIKDSFGNAISPFYTQNYHKIYAIDYRKFYTKLQWFVQTHEVNDIIFSPYLIATQSFNGNDLIGYLCK